MSFSVSNKYHMSMYWNYEKTFNNKKRNKVYNIKKKLNGFFLWLFGRVHLNPLLHRAHTTKRLQRLFFSFFNPLHVCWFHLLFSRYLSHLLIRILLGIIYFYLLYMKKVDLYCCNCSWNGSPCVF